MLRVNKVLRLIQQDYNRDLWWACVMVVVAGSSWAMRM
jgi:hypothetical protein